MGYNNWCLTNDELGTVKDASFKVADAIMEFKSLEAKMIKENRWCGDISKVVSALESAVKVSSLESFLEKL